MKQRFYLDTSVWGGLFDREFEKETVLLFDMMAAGEFICLYSDITESELTKAPGNVRMFFENMPEEQKERVAVTPEALTLAETYVHENVVGQTSFDDCVHIATATVHMEQKTIKENTKTFDTVKTFRKIKENISAEIWGLSYEELMAYFEKSKLEKAKA